jgi:tetratricopeptide (TPR) repeat protein
MQTERADMMIEQALATFQAEILGYGRNAGVIIAAQATAPDHALATAYAACAHLFRVTRDGQAAARDLLAALPACAVSTAHERQMIAAMRRWASGDIAGARAALAERVLGAPDDLFAAKLLQYLQFGAGDARAMLRTIEAVLPRHAGDARAHGMHAFALDQCGRHVDAERAAHRALALGHDPWAHHAIAHVLDARGAHAEGARWMHAHADAWANCSSFLFTHNWWHAALFHIGLGDAEGALALYDDRVWTMRKDYCQDQINAVALLARLELAGVDVGDRWGEVAAYVAPRALEAIDGFLDLHSVYALARAGEDRLVERMIRTVGDAPERRIMPAALAGMAAFARGRLGEAHRLLGGVQGELYRLGGSTVQRGWFDRVIAAAAAGDARSLAA